MTWIFRADEIEKADVQNGFFVKLLRFSMLRRAEISPEFVNFLHGAFC